MYYVSERLHTAWLPVVHDALMPGIPSGLLLTTLCQRAYRQGSLQC